MKKILYLCMMLPAMLSAQDIQTNSGEVLNIYSVNSGEIVTQLRSIAQKLSTSSVWLSTDESTQTKTGGLFINGQINGVIVNHSSLTSQGNAISISTNAGAINTILTSSNTLWLPLDASTNTKIGGITLNGQINNVIITHSSLTTQGNAISISTNAAQVNTIITSSNTRWMALDGSTQTKTGGARFGGNVSVSSLTIRGAGFSANSVNYSMPSADGTSGQVLTVASGLPAWQTLSSTCTNCVVVNPAATQTITPTASSAVGLVVSQASGGSVDIFRVTNNGGGTTYFSVNS